MSQPQKKLRATDAFWIAVAASFVLPLIPFLKYILLPFDYLNTHFHEMFHAIACVMTGGRVDSIKVFINSEGVTTTIGGFGPFISMAGYLGASLLGAFIVKSAHNEANSRKWLKSLAVVLLVVQVIWVRGTNLDSLFGWTIGFIWGFVLLLAANKLNGRTVILAAQFVGIQQCLNSIKSLRDLVILSGTNSSTDAHNMQQMTGIPAIVWALIWLVVGLFGVGMAAVTLNRTPEKN
jgi:hypothetical protein